MNAFYLEKSLWPVQQNLLQKEHIPTKLTLMNSEFHHLTKVLRLKCGEKVYVLDGDGKEALCSITEISKKHATLLVKSIKEYEARSTRVTLAAAWGKAARRGYILEKSVELEAYGLWFWSAQRSQFPLANEIKENWQEQLIAGAKQCHNPFLPKLATYPDGAKAIIEASAHFQQKHLLLEHGYTNDSFMNEKYLANQGDTICVIGPEGGFTQEEVDLFKENGFLALSMGERILRWETAAIMALGLHFWKKQERQC